MARSHLDLERGEDGRVVGHRHLVAVARARLARQPPRAGRRAPQHSITPAGGKGENLPRAAGAPGSTASPHRALPALPVRRSERGPYEPPGGRMGRCRRAGQTAISHHRSHHEGTRAFSASYSRRAARSAASASPPDAAVDGAAAAPGGVSGGADRLRAAARSPSGVGAPSAASLSAAPSLSLRSLAPRFGMIERLRLMYALEPCAREGSSAEGGAFSAIVPSRDDDDDDERGVSRRRCGDDGGGKWLRWSGEMRRDRARSRDRRRRAPARCGLAGCWRPKAARARTCNSAGRPAPTPGECRGGREIVRDGWRDGRRDGSRDGWRDGSQDRARSIAR